MTTEDIFPLGCFDPRLSDHGQISIMFLKLAMLTLIYRSSFQELWEVNQTVIHHTVKSILFLNHVFPDFLTWFIYIFSTHLRLSNGKRLSETARNKALCQWLFIRLPWSAHACLWLRSQQLNRKRPSVLSASGMNMLEHSSQARSIMCVFYKSVLLKQYLRGPPFALLKDRVRQTWMWWLPQYQ